MILECLDDNGDHDVTINSVSIQNKHNECYCRRGERGNIYGSEDISMHIW